MGICAGAFLAASNYSWSLGISNHKTFCETIDVPGIGRKSMWFRGGSAPVTMELTDEGSSILGDFVGVFEVRNHNGPIMSPMGMQGLGTFRPLALSRSAVTNVAYTPPTLTTQASAEVPVVGSRWGHSPGVRALSTGAACQAVRPQDSVSHPVVRLRKPLLTRTCGCC